MQKSHDYNKKQKQLIPDKQCFVFDLLQHYFEQSVLHSVH